MTRQTDDRAARAPAELWQREFRLRISRAILSNCGFFVIRECRTYVKSYTLRTALMLCAFSLSALLPALALAHLGGDADSVDTDRRVFHAGLRSTPMLQYNQHEITTDSGTRVSEYATRQGTVFAVTWQGSLPPDLHQLFGNYYELYQSAVSAQARPGMHRQLTIVGSDLVVQSSARLRAFGGRAYVPSLVPAGVFVADLP